MRDMLKGTKIVFLGYCVASILMKKILINQLLT
jgi:hypothetical protein